MAWTAPVTASVNSTFTAAQWNASVRDNLEQTAPAKASTASWLIVSSGPNQINQREIAEDEIATAETRTLTSYGDLATAGPAVTVTTGTRALIHIAMRIENSSSGTSVAAVDTSGATTTAPSDNQAILCDGGAGRRNRMGITYGLLTLTAGANTFTTKYRVSANTGTFSSRRLTAMAL